MSTMEGWGGVLGLRLGGSLSRGVLCPGGLCIGGLCPGGSLSRKETPVR